MKQLFLSTCALVLFLLAGCKHDPSIVTPPDNEFDLNKAVGLWVPYEYVQGDTLVVPGPFTTMGIFSAYSESVEFKADKTYVPVIWYSATHIIRNELEGGPVEYNKATKQLIFTNGFGYKFFVRKFEGNQLWLDLNWGMYKFEKKG